MGGDPGTPGLGIQGPAVRGSADIGLLSVFDWTFLIAWLFANGLVHHREDKSMGRSPVYSISGLFHP